MGNIAIIPARGGSKRIPRKNIKNFLGKPIIAYSIEIALLSGLFDEVMVSTDDDEIAKIALKYGAKVPFLRSKQNSNDHATTTEVLVEVIGKYEQDLNQVFDYVCCIYPTSTLLSSTHLQKGLSLIHEKEYSTVFPVVEFSSSIWRGIEIDKNNGAKFIWPKNISSRSQDLTPVFHDAGQWYWINPRKLKDSILSENIGIVILKEDEVQDIDNPSDWKIAEYKFKNLREIGEL